MTKRTWIDNCRSGCTLGKRQPGARTLGRARPSALGQNVVFNAYGRSMPRACVLPARPCVPAASPCSTGATLCSAGATLGSGGAAACSTGATLCSAGSLTLPPPFPGTTPAPENTPGFAVAAIGGLPWLALARNAGLRGQLALAAAGRCRRQVLRVRGGQLVCSRLGLNAAASAVVTHSM